MESADSSATVGQGRHAALEGRKGGAVLAKAPRKPSRAGGEAPGPIDVALRERIKELRCLYRVTELAEHHEQSVSDFLQAVAELLPSGWQYPEVTVARVELDDARHDSSDYREEGDFQEAEILVGGRVRGRVEVRYVEAMPSEVEGPFLLEERDLLEAIARKIGVFVRRIEAEEGLRHANERLEVEREALQEANAALRVVLARIEDEKREIRDTIAGNVQRILLPILVALEAELNPDQQSYVRLLRRNLEDIASPLTHHLSRRFLSLSPTELRICNMIQMGLQTKEIARLRGIAPATVNRHRESIRRKLGIVGEEANLASFLQSFLNASDPAPA